MPLPQNPMELWSEHRVKGVRIVPNPKKYKNRKKWMQDCMHQVVHVEKKDKNQGLAQCINMWRHKKARKIVEAFFKISR